MIITHLQLHELPDERNWAKLGGSFYFSSIAHADIIHFVKQQRKQTSTSLLLTHS